MADTITYNDKVDLNTLTNIDDENKVTADDMNEIKEVVNSHADDIDSKLDADKVVNSASTETDEVYSADYLNEKLVSVGTTAPTDGRRVWFAKSKNLFNISTELAGYYINTSNGVIATNSVWSISQLIKVEPNTDYTISASNSTGQLAIIEYTSNTMTSSTFVKVTSTSLGSSQSLTVTTSSTTNYVVAGYRNDKNLTDIQLEEGSTASDYEPYVEQGIYVDEEEMYFDNYSTDEKVIGTWIDGKPIYRKVIETTISLSSSYYFVYTSEASLIQTIDSLIDFKYYIIKGTLIFPVPNGGGTNSDRECGCYIQRSYGGIGLQATSYSNSNINGSTAQIILEYTKTTD